VARVLHYTQIFRICKTLLSLRYALQENIERGCGQLHVKPNGAIDRSKWRIMIRGNWSDRNSDSEAESGMRIVRFCNGAGSRFTPCRFTSIYEPLTPLASNN